MLEPVALHRAGASFRMPGLFQDSRGIVVGSQAAIVVYSQTQLLSLLRILSAETTLAELMPTLRCEEVRSAIGSQGYMLRLSCSESRSLDLCSRGAAFCGVLLCIGSGRHLIQYRDAQAPLGYDTLSLYSGSEGDYVVYSSTAVQAYNRVGELPLLHVLQSQALLNRRGGLAVALREHDSKSPLWLLLPQALLPRILRYLWLRSIDAAVALSDGSVTSLLALGREPRPQAAYALLRVAGSLARSPGALTDLPGLRWLLPLSEHIAVELGHAHPIDLLTFSALFAPTERHLFLASAPGFFALPAAPFVAIERVVQLSEIDLKTPPPAPAATAPAPPPASAKLAALAQSEIALPLVELPLRLSAEATSERTAVAALIPWSQLRQLARLTYALPTATLANLRAAALASGLLVLGDLSHLPLGELFYEAGPQILLPLGLVVVPRLPPALLRAQLVTADDTWIVLRPADSSSAQMTGHAAPTDTKSTLPLAAHSLPAHAFSPLGTLLLSRLQPELLDTLADDPRPPLASDTAPVAVYPSLGWLWPLWGGPRPEHEPARLPAASDDDERDEAGS